MVIILFLFTFLCIFPLSNVHASSQTAYQDYLFQYDGYRSALNEFKVTKSEYQKYKTLTSETTALEKSKKMLETRDTLLRAYLLFLNEKLNEATSLSASNKSLYQTLIKNEVTFLEGHTALIPAIGTITDAEEVSGKLTSHNSVLQSSMRQIIVAIQSAELIKANTTYGEILTSIQNLILKARETMSPEKIATMDRWFLQIQNKRSLYQQKMDSVQTKNTSLKASRVDEIEAAFGEIQKEMGSAKQYLSEGASYLKELTTSMKYID